MPRPDAMIWIMWQRLMKKKAITITPDWVVVAVLTILGAVALSSFTWRQQADLTRDVVIHRLNAHDALWHIALIESLSQGVPPANPLLAGEPLQGYHYFNDVVWMVVHQLTAIPVALLYLQVAPVVLAGLFSFTTVQLFRAVFARKGLAYGGAALSIFGANLVYAAPIFFPAAIPNQYVFWLDQPVHLGINQQLLLSLSVLNLILWLWWQNQAKYWQLIGGLLGILVSIKIYAALLLFPAVSLVGVVEWWREKKHLAILVVLLGAAIAGPLLVLTGNQNGFPFIWEPGWFFKTMFESSDHLNYPRWEIIRQGAVQQGAWLKLAVLWLFAVVVFLVGNFGVKIVGVVTVPLLLRRWRRLDHLTWWLLVSLVVIGSLLVPSLVLQKGVAWNTIQFLPYAYVPLVLLLVKGMEFLVKSSRWQASLLITALIVSVPTTLQTMAANLQPEMYTTIPASITQPLLELRQRRPTQIYVGSSLSRYSLVPAVSGQAVYRADPTMLTILALDQPERVAKMSDLEMGFDNCQAGAVFVQLKNERELQVLECPLAIPPAPGVILNLEQIKQ